MSRTPFAVTLALAALAAACAPSSLAPTTFAAAYRMMASAAEVPTVPQCAAYGRLEVEDAREARQVVGARYLEAGGPRHDVGMDGDVEAWLRAGAEAILGAASVDHDPGSERVITLALTSVTTDESVYRQAEYDGKVIVEVTVSGGGADWSASEEGFAENYGRPGSAVNYQETVNHALDRALASLMADPGFRDALCG
jgi:hypothetical protein